MAKSRGVSGSAVAVGAVGLYLAYVGIKDVSFFDGLRQILRQETPTPKRAHSPYVEAGAGALASAGLRNLGGGGNLGLTGNALRALPYIRAVAPGQIHGFGLRDNVSDHPFGLAMDVMTTDNAAAQRVISVFKTLPGAEYFIWNRQIASKARGWVLRPYTGSNPHTDHVHLSFD